MAVVQEKTLEALIYSKSRSVSAQCAAAFAEIPVDWVRVDDPQFAEALLNSSSYDFVLLDLDSEYGTSLLPDVRKDSECRRHGVIVAITNLETDAEVLKMSYESLIFYPVRPKDICSEVHRGLPLAERINASSKFVPDAHSPWQEWLAKRAAQDAVTAAPQPTASTWRTLASKTADFFSHHSLSIVWQERVASLVSAAGAIWYVHEVTKDWSRLAFLLPATPGPAELIGVSVLLWLCAKHRRFMETKNPIEAAE